MDQKKSFFELLDPKSALIVGLVGGLLSVGTIGFIILGIMLWNGSVSVAEPVSNPSSIQAVNTQPVQIQPKIVDTTPPPNIPKSKRPKVELFVMSYCPYGLQMEKAYLPAWDLLKNKADIDVKFVSYAMHGQKEVEENTRQYCIEKGQGDKYIPYAQCLLETGDNQLQSVDYKACLAKAKVNESKMEACVAATNKKFGIMDKFNDQSTWLSGRYPVYSIHEDLNKKYGVQGSPTLVINGSAVDTGRSAEAVKQAICASFETKPEECATPLANVAFDPGFGMTSSGGVGANGGCGG